MSRLDPPRLLELFGAAFVAAALVLAPFVPAPPSEPSDSDSDSAPQGGWFNTFYLLFLGKTAYGFILPYITKVLADRLPMSVPVILLLLSGVFILGQILGGPILRRWRISAWELMIPVALGATMVTLVVPALAWLVYAGGFIHSVLMLAALMAFTRTPANARQFALLSSLSDPGLVLGAGLAALDEAGIAGLAIMCLVPLARRLRAIR